MVLTSRRRSVLARGLLVGAFVLLIPPYVAFFGDLHEQFPAGYISLAQIALQVSAIWFLFTAQSRAWFAGRQPVPDEIED